MQLLKIFLWIFFWSIPGDDQGVTVIKGISADKKNRAEDELLYTLLVSLYPFDHRYAFLSIPSMILL